MVRHDRARTSESKDTSNLVRAGLASATSKRVIAGSRGMNPPVRFTDAR